VKTESVVRILAGTLVLFSLALTYFHPWWLMLAGFVGVNLIQSAFTSFCLVQSILRKLGGAVGSHSDAHPTRSRLGRG
jgi:hypothetical protein